MAIFHLSVQVLTRSQGDKAVAAAAYRSGSRMYDERYEMVHNYLSREYGVVHSEILAPVQAPAWADDREALWNMVEACEKRKDSQLAREMDIALPRELSDVERTRAVRDFLEKHVVSEGMIADFSIHEREASDGGQNPHAHVMITMRTVTAEGFGRKETKWNDKELVKRWRSGWREVCNEALDAAGSDARIDERSLEEQGILRDPSIHMGKEAWNAQARGEEPIRQQKNAVERSLGPLERQIESEGQLSLQMTPEAGEGWLDRIAEFSRRVGDRASEWYGRIRERVDNWIQDVRGPEGPTMER